MNTVVALYKYRAEAIQGDARQLTLRPVAREALVNPPAIEVEAGVFLKAVDVFPPFDIGADVSLKVHSTFPPETIAQELAAMLTFTAEVCAAVGDWDRYLQILEMSEAARTHMLGTPFSSMARNRIRVNGKLRPIVDIEKAKELARVVEAQQAARSALDEIAAELLR